MRPNGVSPFPRPTPSIRYPFPARAVDILRELYPLTGRGRCVFPSGRTPKGDRPMSENAILAALRRLDIGKEKMSGHGFRAMARTLLDEVLGFRPDFIEHQLAHAVRDPHGRAYNRTAFLQERRKMMQEWADYLERLRVGDKAEPTPAGRPLPAVGRESNLSRRAVPV